MSSGCVPGSRSPIPPFSTPLLISTESSFPSTGHAPASGSAGSGANECGVCGTDEPQSPTPTQTLAYNSIRKMQISPSAVSSHTSGNAIADATRELVEHFWIQCDVCEQWYHGKCVAVQEYESALIDRYHCARCSPQHGPSLMKEVRLDHRYAFDDLSQSDLPTQIGTKRFIEDFKQQQDRFPLATEKCAIYVENGHEFMRDFNMRKEWKKPYLIGSPEGLLLKMPEASFTLDDCAKLIGENRSVDTIDVYKQHTYHMQLNTFFEKFRSRQRPRLYNILSLEFSNSKLSEVVQPPEVVRELSWVHRFWPSDSSLSSPSLVPPPLAGDVHYEHLRAKPEVALFCLVGMRDSYTDFHIDFGGSSVWYHVFQGQKIFYVVEPSEENLKQFVAYQNDPKRSEYFFGDRLPPNSVHKLIVNQGNTLMIPSGWIHAVWTPLDSLVFGGNFLHSLNIAIVYEIEIECETDERFMFPSFELTNWYAARSLLDAIKESNEDGKIADNYLLKGAEAMLPVLRRWMKRDRSNKKMLTHVTFSNILQKLQKEVNVQEKLRKTTPTVAGNPGDARRLRRVKQQGVASSPSTVRDSQSPTIGAKIATKSRSQCAIGKSPARKRKMDAQVAGEVGIETVQSGEMPPRVKADGEKRKRGQAAPVRLKLIKDSNTGTLLALSPIAIADSSESPIKTDIAASDAAISQSTIDHESQSATDESTTISTRMPLKLTIGRLSSVESTGMLSPGGSYAIKKDSMQGESPAMSETPRVADEEVDEEVEARNRAIASPCSFSMLELKKQREVERARGVEREQGTATDAAMIEGDQGGVQRTSVPAATTKITIRIGRAMEATTKALAASHRPMKKSLISSLVVADEPASDTLEGVDLAAMFAGRSSHGRAHKPTAWLADVAGPEINRLNQNRADSTTRQTSLGTPTAKKFPPSATGSPPSSLLATEKQQRAADKAAEKEEREMMRAIKLAGKLKKGLSIESGGGVQSARGSASHAHKTKKTTAKQRLASKLKIKL